MSNFGNAGKYGKTDKSLAFLSVRRILQADGMAPASFAVGMRILLWKKELRIHAFLHVFAVTERLRFQFQSHSAASVNSDVVDRVSAKWASQRV